MLVGLLFIISREKRIRLRSRRPIADMSLDENASEKVVNCYGASTRRSN